MKKTEQKKIVKQKLNASFIKAMDRDNKIVYSSVCNRAIFVIIVKLRKV